ncbi:hypothetical protein Bca52824_012705 [Brassica carinata]|uniref:Uncharacterized protein n=1 Tax=Brassica carinata TaxID=52824 RepID=A0A8X8B2N1_BRACI|nr:hypothetical protein Bca52824_012705 [Brassica carinata]
MPSQDLCVYSSPLISCLMVSMSNKVLLLSTMICRDSARELVPTVWEEVERFRRKRCGAQFRDT